MNTQPIKDLINATLINFQHVCYCIVIMSNFLFVLLWIHIQAPFGKSSLELTAIRPNALRCSDVDAIDVCFFKIPAHHNSGLMLPFAAACTTENTLLSAMRQIQFKCYSYNVSQFNWNSTRLDSFSIANKFPGCDWFALRISFSGTFLESLLRATIQLISRRYLRGGRKSYEIYFYIEFSSLRLT